MPVRVAGAAGTIRKQIKSPYICPKCLLNAGQSGVHSPNRPGTVFLELSKRRRVGESPLRHTSPPSTSLKPRDHPRGYATVSLASASAINPTAAIPSKYRALYQRLANLQEIAGDYIDLSRLQLALRSLESNEPVLRVALLRLGKDGTATAQRLARVLLSDALGKEQGWEKDLIAAGNDGKSILLQYGDIEPTVQSSAIVRNMRIPARFLRENNLEILITPMNSSSHQQVVRMDKSQLEDAVLVPSLTTPTSAEGRVGFVRYPVHKAIIIANGVMGAIDLGRSLPSFDDNSLITAALDIPQRETIDNKTAESAATAIPVDVDMATNALQLFRTDIANGADFSRLWQLSRVTELAEWMKGAQSLEGHHGMDASVHSLIASTLTNAAAAIEKSTARANALVTAQTVSNEQRAELGYAVAEWSSASHRDLQTNLDSALESPTWRRTTWWRLFWRLDDISVSLADMLRRNWLAESEQSLTFLSGRIVQSGLAKGEDMRRSESPLMDEDSRASMAEYESAKAKKETIAEIWQMPSLVDEMRKQTGINALFDPPWPQSIQLSRQYMIHTTVPDLHIKAQALLFTSLSTFAGSVALGSWLYVASAGLALYESGAVVALGLAWSSRRLQKHWGKARETFVTTLQEQGRSIIRELEARLNGIVQNGGRSIIRAEDENARKAAKNAISSCRDALDSLS